MRKTYLAALVVLAVLPSNANAQIGAIVTGATIGSLVDQLEGSVKNTINRVSGAVDANTFRIRQHGEILLSQLDAIASNQRDKTFAQLNATEQKAFVDIKASIDQLAHLQKATATDVQQATNRVGTAMANLPLGKSTPRVTDYGPVYVVSTTDVTGAMVQVVTVAGMVLGEGTPKLRIKGVDCSLLSKTEISLRFSCPSKTWTAPSGVGSADGDLEVYQKAGFFKSLFGGKPEVRPYKLSIFVVPPELGKYNLAVTRKVTTQRTQARSQDYRSENGHCDGDRDVLFPFNVTPGWAIDPASIQEGCNSSERSSCQGKRDLSATSFAISTVVRNSGDCGPKVFGHHTWVDAKGNVRGTVTWTETIPVDAIVTEPAGQGSLEWGKAVQLPLPSGVQAISLTIEQLDKKRVIVVGNDMAQRWYTVQSDPVNNYVLVSPRSLDDAMGL